MTDEKSPISLNQKALRRKLSSVNRLLKRRFGSPRWRGPGDPLESMVVTILSQNTNDINRDRAWQSLRKAFPTWELLLAATPLMLMIQWGAAMALGILIDTFLVHPLVVPAFCTRFNRLKPRGKDRSPPGLEAGRE